jgi:uncharacterized protein
VLQIELRDLEKGDVHIDRVGPLDALGIRPAPESVKGPVELHCTVTLQAEYVLAHGWIAGLLNLPCDRCLKDFEQPFRTCVELQFRKSSGQEAASQASLDNPDILFFDGETVELGDEIRQLLELSVPMRSICSEKCRGLCGGCGADLNLEKCRCAEPPPDPRWNALKSWKP